MNIRLEINASSFGELIDGIAGAMAHVLSQRVAFDPPDMAEVVDPPKKPSRQRRGQTLDLNANPPEAPATSPAVGSPEPTPEVTAPVAQEVEAPATPAAGNRLDYATDVQKTFIAYVNAKAELTPNDPEAKHKVLKEIKSEFNIVGKLADQPQDKLRKLLDLATEGLKALASDAEEI